MIKYKLILEPSEDKRVVIVNTEDLGYAEREWKQLSDEDQRHLLQKYADDLSEQPYWYASKIEQL